MDLGRVSVGARVLALIGLIVALLLNRDPQSGLPLFLVMAVAVVASAVAFSGRSRHIWIAIAEGAVVGVIVAATHPAGAAVIPYLAVPLVLGGLAGHLAGVGRVLIAELLGSVLAWFTLIEPTTQAPLRETLVWVGVGLLLGAAGSMLRTRFPLGMEDASYRDAIALIRQLNHLSDKLTGGLDPVALAEQMMTEADIALPVRHAVVYTRGRTPGTVTPLRYSTFTPPSQFSGSEVLVERAWVSEHGVAEGPRVGLPLRANAETVGVLVLDLTTPAEQRTLARLQETLSPLSLQLQAALLFDEVRAQATSEERNRLAREVHDGVAQDVASLGYLVDSLADSADPDQQQAIRDLRAEVTRVVAELRASVYDLRNEMRGGQGLGQGISDFARQIGSRSDLTVHVRLDEGATRLRPEIEAELLRIAQEAMNNARKHSRGQNLWVSCTVRPPHAEIEVLDDGDGLQHARHDSHGMRIMRERAETIGAILEVESLGGAPYGTRLRVRLGSL